VNKIPPQLHKSPCAPKVYDMAYDSDDLHQTAIITLAELQQILCYISHDNESWAASLNCPIDPAHVWWSGDSVFVSHTYSAPADHLVNRMCFRFPAFLGGHSDDSAMLVCLHPMMADFVSMGALSPKQQTQLDVFGAFNRLWKPIGMQVAARNCRLHCGSIRIQEG
jgi:hypothetical protein